MPPRLHAPAPTALHGRATLLHLLLALLCAAPLAGCGGDPPPAPAGPAYSDITEAAGITFEHTNGAYGKMYFPETMGGGCAFLDYDLDGDQDVLMINGSYWRPWHRKKGDPRPTMGLYRNTGGSRFKDVTKDAELGPNFYGLGVAVADVDGDRDSDLLITGIGGNDFLRNEGARFVDATETAMVKTPNTLAGTMTLSGTNTAAASLALNGGTPANYNINLTTGDASAAP